MNIELLQYNDIQNLYDLECAIFGDEGYSLNQFFTDFDNKNYIFLVAKNSNNKIIAYISANYLFDNADIIKIGVDHNYRKMGVATKLFNKLVEVLKAHNILNIMLEVASKNHSAIKFYEKCGFEKIDLRKNYYKNDDAVIMLYTLSF